MSRWFISYKFIRRDFLNDEVIEEKYCFVITDVSPARWTLYANVALKGERYILYAEELSLALASELIHGGAGIPTAYFKENEDGIENYS